MALLKNSKQLKNDDEFNPPLVKLRRLEMPSLSKKELHQPRLSLRDLADDVVYCILGYLNITDCSYLRGTSRRLRVIVEDFVRHEYRKELYRCTCADPNGSQQAVLETIARATELYVESGFEFNCYVFMLPMLREAPRDPFRLDVVHVSKVFLRFLHQLDKLIDGPRCKPSQMFHILTMMKLLKCFSKTTIISSTISRVQWRTVIEVVGPWFGRLHPYPKANHTLNIKKLLVLLTETLISDRKGEPFKRVFEDDHEVYVFGNGAFAKRKRLPKTVFTVRVSGSRNIYELLSKCMENEQSAAAICAMELQKEPFAAIIEIRCQYALWWGCPKKIRIQCKSVGEKQLIAKEKEDKRKSRKRRRQYE